MQTPPRPLAGRGFSAGVRCRGWRVSGVWLFVARFTSQQITSPSGRRSADLEASPDQGRMTRTLPLTVIVVP